MDQNIINFIPKAEIMLREEVFVKELYICHKLKYLNTYMFATSWCKTSIFQLRPSDLTEFYDVKLQRYRD